ncbi:MAG: DMT family transporter, partial [Rhodobacteraceae bacterium]|nr:DMT family transporter [Paracoccaceae bacterium]
FNTYVLLALVGVLGLSIRDLATRRAPATVSSLQMSFYGFLMGLPAAGLLAIYSGDPWVAPDARLVGLLIASVVIGPLGYYAVTAAMRVGEVSFVTPFRYSRMVFALVIAILVFGERPDGMMLFGTAIIIASGLYTLWRERNQSRLR